LTEPQLGTPGSFPGFSGGFSGGQKPLTSGFPSFPPGFEIPIDLYDPRIDAPPPNIGPNGGVIPGGGIPYGSSVTTDVGGGFGQTIFDTFPSSDALRTSLQQQLLEAPRDFLSTSIPTLAHGGRVQPGGRAIVGEGGPELLSLDSRGGLVTPVNRGQLSSLQNSRIPGFAHGGDLTHSRVDINSLSPYHQNLLANNPIGSIAPTAPPTGPGLTSPQLGTPGQESPIISSDNPSDPGSTSDPGVNFGSQFDFSNGFDLSPGATGQDLLNLPAVQALYGANLTFPGDQTFDLPEVGLSNIPGIAAGAHLFRQGVLTPQEQADLYSFYGVGFNIPQSAIQHIVNQFPPGSTAFGGGQGSFTQPVGF